MLFVKADESNSDAMGPSAVPTTNLGVLVCGWLPKGVTSGRYATCCVRVPSALEKALDPVHGAVGARLSCHTPCTHTTPSLSHRTISYVYRHTHASGVWRRFMF